MFDAKDAVCDRLEDEFEKRMDILRKAKELSGDAMSALNDALGALTPTDGFNDLLNSIPEIPSFGDSSTLEEIKNMIAQCLFLSDNTQFSNPISLLKGIKDTIVSAGKGVISALNLPEVDAAMLMDQIKELFGVNGLDLKSAVEAMDKILNCLSSVCGRETSTKITEMQSIMDDLRLTDTGDLNSDGIFSENGLSGEVLTNIQSAKSKIESAQSSIESQVKSFKVPGI